MTIFAKFGEFCHCHTNSKPFEIGRTKYQPLVSKIVCRGRSVSIFYRQKKHFYGRLAFHGLVFCATYIWFFRTKNMYELCSHQHFTCTCSTYIKRFLWVLAGKKLNDFAKCPGAKITQNYSNEDSPCTRAHCTYTL